MLSTLALPREPEGGCDEIDDECTLLLLFEFTVWNPGDVENVPRSFWRLIDMEELSVVCTSMMPPLNDDGGATAAGGRGDGWDVPLGKDVLAVCRMGLPDDGSGGLLVW